MNIEKLLSVANKLIPNKTHYDVIKSYFNIFEDVDKNNKTNGHGLKHNLAQYINAEKVAYTKLIDIFTTNRLDSISVEDHKIIASMGGAGLYDTLVINKIN